MGFKDTEWIDLHPITLLFGKNSSGKSAIIRALRLLKQSLDHGTSAQPIVLAVEDGLDMGKFATTVFDHELDSIITFSFRCDFVHLGSNETYGIVELIRNRVNSLRIRHSFSEIHREDTPTELDLSLSFGWDIHRQLIVPVAIQVDCPWKLIADQGLKTIIAFERQREDLVDELDKGISEYNNDVPRTPWTWIDNWFLWSDILNEHEEVSRESHWEAFNIELESGFIPQLIGKVADAFYKPQIPPNDFDIVKKVLNDFRGIIEDFLRTIEYVGPMRPEPLRRYSLNQFEQVHWKQRGWSGYIEFLSNNIKEEEKAREIGYWLDALKLGDSVDINSPFSGQSGLISEVEISDVARGRKDNICDVGYGVSQVLPVVVQSVLATLGTLVIVEQPELHLHPFAQSELMDMFIRQTYNLQIQELENGNKELDVIPSGVRFLIETHSEHLLLRIRRRIAETTAREMRAVESSPHLTTENTGVYFVDKDNNHSLSIVEPVEINEFGEYSASPSGFEGFFSNDLKEMAELSKIRLYTKDKSGNTND